VEQMSRPGDATRHSWQVTYNWWIVLVLLILVLDLVDLQSIVMEQDVVLGVESISQIVSVEDGLELSEEFQGVFDAGNDLEVLVNVVLELSLD
jgi:hypothetical protein